MAGSIGRIHLTNLISHGCTVYLSIITSFKCEAESILSSVIANLYEVPGRGEVWSAEFLHSDSTIQLSIRILCPWYYSNLF